MITLSSSQYSHAHDSSFVITSGSSLHYNGKPFYPVGVNCYYLQNLAAVRDTLKVNEIFVEAKRLGIRVIRIWGFFDSPDSTKAAVIQYAPGKYNENGLRALDYVIAKAREYSIHLVIPFVNNWEAYGGMNQYVAWYSEKNFQKPYSQITNQQLITGDDERSYRYKISGNLTHDDFYINETIRNWYKNYVSKILNRVNTYTGITYRNETSIMMWELANEPRSSDKTGEVVFNWISEMAAYIKTIDSNHLVGTGEEGFDVSTELVKDPSKYAKWMLDGSAGISFTKNITIMEVNVASIHMYPEAWKLKSNNVIDWINDHLTVSDHIQKPLIIGEVGFKKNKSFYYDALLSHILHNNINGILLWQLGYKGSRFIDSYSFDCLSEHRVCNVILNYSDKFELKENGQLEFPTQNKLLQNYPNPFNNITMVTYTIEYPRYILLEVYNVLGQKVSTLADNYHQPGEYKVIFDGMDLPSGAYYVLMRSDHGYSVIKTILIR